MDDAMLPNGLNMQQFVYTTAQGRWVRQYKSVVNPCQLERLAGRQVILAREGFAKKTGNWRI